MQGPPHSPTHPVPSGAGPTAHSPTELRGKERPYGLVLLLYVVTLGIYGLYWHYKVHDELCQQLGRENRDKGIWFGYIATWAVVAVVALIFAGMVLALFAQHFEQNTEPSEEEVIGVVTGALTLLAVILVASLVALVLLIVYVLRQFNLLDETYRRFDGQMRLSSGGFMGLYFGGVGAAIVIPFVGWIVQWVLHIIAYYLLQENYNDIWRALRQGRPIPTDEQWAAGGARAQQPTSNAWDAPMAAAAQPTAAPSPAPPPQRTPTQSGYSVRAQRSPGASGAAPGAPAGALVHQSFECPRCRAHIAASGPPGSAVDIRCTHCGEGGRVTLPGP